MTKKSAHAAKAHPAPRKRGDSHHKPRASVRHDPAKHWIVVTDHKAKRAHIYHKTPKGFEIISDVAPHCSQPLPDAASANDAFVRDLADWLDTAEREKAYDRLVLIGPPETLAVLHPILEKNVNDRLCAALEREIASVLAEEIEDHLAEVMWH